MEGLDACKRQLRDANLYSWELGLTKLKGTIVTASTTSKSSLLGECALSHTEEELQRRMPLITNNKKSLNVPELVFLLTPVFQVNNSPKVLCK